MSGKVKVVKKKKKGKNIVPLPVAKASQQVPLHRMFMMTAVTDLPLALASNSVVNWLSLFQQWLESQGHIKVKK